METLDELIDLARGGLNVRSDRELGKRLGLTPAGINQYRTGRSMPNDANVVKLADAAGLAPGYALLMLCQWRTRGPANRAYRAITDDLYHPDGRARRKHEHLRNKGA